MPEYYYTNAPTSEHEDRHFTTVFMGKTLAFDTDAGVFSKQHVDPGSELLCKSLPELHGRVLDLGCGWGAMTVMTLSRFPSLDVTMSLRTICWQRLSCPMDLLPSRASLTP